jgi:single-stranded-DNA-specific exonuclease
MRFRWDLAPAQPLLAGQLAQKAAISPLLAQCLVNRGLGEPPAIQGFLEPRLKQLAEPFLLPDMEKAVERLLVARQRGERVVIFGDYDVDGVTSTALLLEALRGLGWAAEYYLPHRLEEGYGLSREAVENCWRRFPSTLWLAVDCGSATVDSIDWLKQQGVQVIVLDHHQVSTPAPAALALVNPQVQRQPTGSAQLGDSGSGVSWPPFGELCSVGLAFKLAHALVKRGRAAGLSGAAEFDLRPLLDLVAVGTIADQVPLTGENRILVSAGLARLNATRRPGLVALKQVAQCPPLLGVYETAFQLAPRLNAAGRLERAEDALRLLLARDSREATALARVLDGRNRERQQLERTIAEQVFATVTGRFDPARDFVVVEGRVPWHIGVVGIVAARVLQQYYRPTIIVGGEGGLFRGSGRSIAGFDLAAALRECGDLLVRRVRLNEVARRRLPAGALQPVLRLDAEVGLEEMTLESLSEFSRLQPVGQGNPAIHLVARNLVHQRPLQRLGADKQHVKMWVADGPHTLEAVWWGGGKQSLPVGWFDLAFAPQMNEYKGRRTVQLKVLDWRTAQTGI